MKPILLFILLPFLASQVFAQQSYSFTVDNRSYEPLDNPTDLVPESWDDPGFVWEIGFEFEYFGSKVSSFIEDNLGAGLFVSSTFNQDTFSILFPCASDLADRGMVDGSHISKINTQVLGNPSNRISVLEYEDAGFYNEIDELGISKNYINFQLRLHEFDNTIEIHYGESNIVLDELVHDPIHVILLASNVYEDANTFETFAEQMIALRGDHRSPDFLTYENILLDTLAPDVLGLNDDPLPNTIYRFSPVIISSTNVPPKSLELDIYPTLANTYININDVPTDGELRIISINGQRMHVAGVQKGDSVEVNVSAWTTGVYFMHLESKSGIISTTFVKK